jgi:hypothetical protein
MKLISLNIHFDQINALAGFEVIVKGYNIDSDGAARIRLRRICPVVDV